jgi:putative pyoverdin transport system ATP-binding/permease protein
VQLLRFFFRLQARSMILAILAGILSGVGNVLFIATVNRALNPNAASLPYKAAALAGLCVAVVVLRFSSDVILIRLSEKLVYELRIRLSREILGVPLRQIEVIGPHSLFTVLTEDVGRLAELALNIPNVCVNAAIVAAGLFYLFALSVRVASIVVLAIVLGVSIYSLLRVRGAQYFHRAREQQNELMRHFRALTDGIKEMKLNGIRKAGFISRLEATARDLQCELVAGSSMSELALSWAQLTFLTLISILVLPDRTGPYGLALAVVSGTILALLCIRAPMETIVEMFMNLTQAQVSLSKIDQLGLSLRAEKKEPTTEPGFQSVSSLRGIEMREVTYSYSSEAESFTLGPLDLSFYPGEVIFISGGNGSGKTTFLKLLSGLYGPESGYMKCNDALVEDLARDEYRSRFSVIFSDFHLSSNIARTPCAELDEMANRYLKEFRLDHKVTVRDGVFSTINLSQGQRKRLALAAACLEDKPIYVFDEWAADQDVFFRQKFYREVLLELKRKGKTLFVVTHDHQYFDIADRILVLEEGKLRKDMTAANAELSHFVSQPQMRM